MFSLIRRISHSVIPRPDRPWEDDPTSNAPNTRRKRRLSSTEPLADPTDEGQTRKKKLRGESTELDLGGEDSSLNDPAAVSSEDGDGEAVRREGSLEVKDVTKGVKEVELEDNDTVDAPQADKDDKETIEEGKDATVDGCATNPESIPLPEEEAGELDEPSSSLPPQTHSQPGYASPATTDTELVNSAPINGVEKAVVAEGQGGKETSAPHPSTPPRSSTRKSRSSPKKVSTTKA